MGRSLKEVLNELPADDRRAVEERRGELIREVEALRELRSRHRLSQAELAKRLNKSQAAISKIENESDMLLSTLRGYLEAMGYGLELVVTTPDDERVRIGSLSDLAAPSGEPPRKPRSDGRAQ